MADWKDIKGYEGLYQISNTGQVKSLGRYQKGRFGNLSFYKEKILKMSPIDGYKAVCLCKDAKGKTHWVHKLVAHHFIDNKENKPQINHIDGDKKNNNYENLEWCTYHENLSHAMKNNLRATCERNGSAKLKNNQVLKIREIYRKKEKTIKELMEIYGVAYSTMQQLVTNVTWKNL